MTEISSGEILIDGIDVSSILQQSLRHLTLFLQRPFVYSPMSRSRLAVIPQDPFLFSGTIKQNLDPSSTVCIIEKLKFSIFIVYFIKASDAELRFVLAKCHLLDAVDALGLFGLFRFGFET